MAVHMVTGARRCDRITLIREEGPTWLPVSQRVVFKTALMVWKCIHGAAPAYLSDLCIPSTDTFGREKLRSTSSRILLGSACLDCSRPAKFGRHWTDHTTWNSLPPVTITGAVSVTERLHTYTHLFSPPGAVETFYVIPALNN